MNRKIGGAALLGIAGFMLLGFLRSNASLFTATGFVAVALTVGLPAFFGVTLLRGALSGTSKSRMQALRQQTIDAEILRLALQQKGRLTSVEVASALAIPEAEAAAALEGLALRDTAELQITDDGVLVYHFRDARLASGKHDAKDILDA